MRDKSALFCNHCGNISKMDIISQCSDLTNNIDESGYSWEEGLFYVINKCPACGEHTITRYYWHPMMEGYEDEDIKQEQIYPVQPQVIKGLPMSIDKAYKSALRIKAIDPNSYAVMLGRMLELICEDKHAKGENLFTKLKYLSEQGIIPGPLSEIAQNLRKLRNIGAHASLGELNKQDVPVLDSLTRAIIEYIYSAPLLVKEAQQAFDQITSNKK